MPGKKWLSGFFSIGSICTPRGGHSPVVEFSAFVRADKAEAGLAVADVAVPRAQVAVQAAVGLGSHQRAS